MKKRVDFLLIFAIFLGVFLPGNVIFAKDLPDFGNPVLSPASFQHYVEQFNADDEETIRQVYPNEKAWEFMSRNIPLLDFPDQALEKTWYFRWWTFRKSIKRTADGGYVLTEFHSPVPWAGKENAISCPAGHHFREARWIHDQEILNDYARFWLFGGGALRSYSFWIADSVWQQALVTGDTKPAVRLLDALVKNYEAWENERLDPNGLFWQQDGRDGMEVSVGGSGYRATINTYLFADALAISRIAGLAGRLELQKEYEAKAERIKKLLNERLWDREAGFFKVAPRINFKETDSPEKVPLALRDVRELHGFTPWYADEGSLPRPEYVSAWEQLMDPKGFYAPYGPTTCEQRHPGFRVSYEGHECQWNGPSWPYATSITLTALANQVNLEAKNGFDLEKSPMAQAHRKAFTETLDIYVKCHQRTREDGKIVPWIDENINPFTGDWIARTRLRDWGWRPAKGGYERGKDYSHSTFCDLIINGLIGVRPSLENGFTLFPLVERDIPWFCLDRLPYHGKTLTILWDAEGKRYGRGKGLRVAVDGKEIFAAETLPKSPVWISFDE